MIMGSNSRVGMEVPFISTDSINWIQASVPASHPSSSSSSSSPSIAPPSQDCASCSVIGDTSPTYLIWRICKRLPHAIEILELNADKDIARVGLRILFPEALSPFAYICKNEITSAHGNMYMLYVLSTSGIVYLLQLKNISSYAASFIFSSNEVLHFNTNTSPDCSTIAAATATAGCFIIGRDDGSVSCFKLGVLDENSPGFMYELRDEAALSRLWGFVSRSRLAGSVSDLVVSDIHGRKVVFVLHSDGSLRIWDLLRHNKLFNQSLSSPGTTLLRLWVGPVDVGAHSIPLAIMYTQSMEVNTQGISICNLNFPSGDRNNLSLGSSMHYIPLSQGKLIDVKLLPNKIWVLKEDGLLEQDLFSLNFDEQKEQRYSLQEAFIAEQLFQSSENALDDLYQTTCSIFSSSKVQIVGFVSSIFLRRLLHPGVYKSSVLRLTLEDYEKRWTDNEFQSMTIDELSKEILLIIEHEAISGSSYSALKCWKEFCSRYFDRWCKSNTPFSLLVDSSSEGVGLIRENSVSLFRSLQDIELLVNGTFDELKDFPTLGFDASSNGLQHEILFEVLRCSRHLSQRLGPAVSPIIYESVVGVPMISSEDILPRLLNTLKCGYNASVVASNVSDLGSDFLWKKELSEHKSLRKFTMDALISIHGLYEKASGWGEVLNVIECYLNLLVPRKPSENLVSDVILSSNVSIIVQATSQVAERMFESALNVLLFLNYILDISGQVHMPADDMSKIQLELNPMIHEIIAEWLIIHFLATMPSESHSAEDFSSQLSSLQIDNDASRRSWTAKLGSIDFTLAYILALDAQGSSDGWSYQSLSCLPSPGSFTNLVQDFSGWLILGTSEKPLYVFWHSTDIALRLLRHGQYTAAENLLMIVDAHLRNEKLSGSVQNNDGHWSVLHHLRGCSLLAQARSLPCGPSKEKKVCEAMRCFFRASSGEGASSALQKLPIEAGLSHLDNCVSAAAWKLHYYQWVMQKFEQYNMSDVACQFALSALEQVDESVAPDGNGSMVLYSGESATAIKGRLWANVFKFALDRDQYYDAYCALVSNPDDENRFICLRRFIIVLYERGATKILCDSHLPFIGLTDKAEQELAWKAACSDISAKPNPYKLLYAFEMHQQNWRKAATYIYLHSAQLKNEMTLRSHQNTSLILQERLNGISAAINCLHLVHPMYAWIDSQMVGSYLKGASQPSKKARTEEKQAVGVDIQAQSPDSYISIEKLEDEFVVTSAEYLLSLENVKWLRSECQNFKSDLVNHLVEANLYDMAFTVVLRFWKDSGLKRELERVFSAMALKCCPSKASIPMVGSPGLLLTYSKDEMMIDEPFNVDPQLKQTKTNQWEALEQYLEKYKGFHGRLPVVVAETLLRSDSQIELPLWLVDMFKGAWSEVRGMTGQESNPATLFRLYVDYGRYPEATELLVEYIEGYASMRPAGIIQRKKPFATWFPYTAIESLWCRLEETIHAGYMSDQCEKLKVLLHGALRSHLILLKTDSEDAISSVH